MPASIRFGLPWEDHPKTASSAFSLSPDGCHVAYFAEGTIVVIARESRERVTLPGKTSPGVWLEPTFSPRDGRLMVGMPDGAIQIWELGNQSGSELPERAAPATELHLTFSSNGSCLGVSTGARLTLFDMESGRRRFAIEEDVEALQSIAIAADSGLVAIVPFFGESLLLLDGTSGARCGEIKTPAKPQHVAFAPRSHTIVASWSDGYVRCFAADGSARGELAIEGLSVAGDLAVSPDGSLIAVVVAGGIEVWHLDEKLRLERLSMPLARDHIGGVRWSVDGTALIASSCDGHVYVWPVTGLPAAQAYVDTAAPRPGRSAPRPAPTDLARVRSALRRFAERGYQWTASALSRGELASFDASAFCEAGGGARLLWANEDWEAAFDRDGRMVAPLPLRWALSSWSGDHCPVQCAFAAEGLAPHFELDGHELVLTPEGCARQTDLVRIVAALGSLRAIGYIAEPSWAETTSACWENVAERRARDQRRAVFWNHQSHRGAFDADGQLRRGLMLHWEGNAAEIAAPLRDAGFDVVVPESESSCIEVRARSDRPTQTP